MAEKTIFERIIEGEVPSYKIAENEQFFAFLDISPVQAGHTLIVPRRATDYIFDIEDIELSAMMVFAKKIAKAIKKAVHCKKVAVAVIGLEVNHAHIHLIPITKEGDMDFRKKMSLKPEQMLQIQKDIVSFL